MKSETLVNVIPVRLDKKTIAAVRKLAKQRGKLATSTMLRVLILEALKEQERLALGKECFL